MASAASPQRTSAIAMLAASVLTGGREPAIQRLFDLMAEDTRAAWQRGALMLGAEVAVLGAPAPGGTPAARGRGAARGRRRRAVPDVPWRARRTGRSESVQSQSWRQPLKPAAPGSGDHARARAGAGAAGPAHGRRARPACDKGARSRAHGLASRVRPSPQRRRSAPSISSGSRRDRPSTWRGARDVIRTTDAASRASGRPSRDRPGCSARRQGLPASCCTARKALPASCLRRGATMTDEQVASVLTYIRRAWDNTASPVDAAVVSSVRAQTAGRDRPWTEAELSAVWPYERKAVNPVP